MYISLDSPLFQGIDLVVLVAELVRDYGIDILCLDEIHLYTNRQSYLKSLIDSFPQMQIYYSGSSAIDILS